jgi:hypothetical protein
MYRSEQRPVPTAKEIWKEMRPEVYAEASGNRYNREQMYSDDSTKLFSIRDIDEIFEKIGNSTVGSQPAEWSEEDENKLRHALFNTYAVDTATYLFNKLKSLRPQPKQEWNEEDEKMLVAISKALVCDTAEKILEYEGVTLVMAADFLASLKNRGNFPKSNANSPYWKPSEEQIEVYTNAIYFLAKHGFKDQNGDLESLYDDLKKLM